MVLIVQYNPIDSKLFSNNNIKDISMFSGF